MMFGRGVFKAAFQVLRATINDFWIVPVFKPEVRKIIRVLFQVRQLVVQGRNRSYEPVDKA